MIFFLYGCNSSILEVEEPTINIRYSVPHESYVKLTVENGYSTLIATLADETKGPGHYEVRFDTTNLAEGVYFYTIEIKGVFSSYYYEATKNMLLVK